MKRLCLLHKSGIQTCGNCTEGCDSTDDLRLIALSHKSVMNIEICGIHGRISQCEKYHVFTLVQDSLDFICSCIVIALQHLRILGHWKRNCKKLLLSKLRISPLHDLKRYRILRNLSRKCDHLCLLYKTKCF